MTLKEVLENVGQNIVEDSQKNLKKTTPHGKSGKKFNSIASSNLYHSIKSKVVSKTGSDNQFSFEIEIEMLNYGYWINDGRLATKKKGNGKTFTDSIKTWMAYRGLDSTNKGLVYVIKRSIHKNGFRATHFFDNAVDNPGIMGYRHIGTYN